MRKKTTRLTAEPLEARTVPTAGLDWTYGRAGRAIVPFPADYGNVVETATDAEGRTLLLRQLNTGLAVARLTPAGKLDHTFGTGGIARFDFGPPPPQPLPLEPQLGSEPVTGLPGFVPTDFALDADGRVVIVGTTYSGVYYPAFGTGSQVAVLRLTTAGELDESYDGDGMAQVATGSASSVAVGPDGTIVVGGSIVADNPLPVEPVPPHTGGSSLVAWPTIAAVYRLTADGKLDPSFDSDGIIKFRFVESTDPWSYDAVADLGVDGLGRVVAVGGSGERFHVVRFTSGGAFDTSFDGDGKLDVSFGSSPTTPPDPSFYSYAYANKLFVAADGTATLGGSVSTWLDDGGGPVSFTGVAVVRVSPAGVPQPTWYQNNPFHYLVDLSVDADGHTILTTSGGAYAYAGSPPIPPAVPAVLSHFVVPYQPLEVTVTRLNVDGSLDDTFGPEGEFNLPHRLGRLLAPSSMAVQADGKDPLAGSAYGLYGSAATVIRIDPDAPPRTNRRPPVAVSGDGGTVKIYRPNDAGELALESEVTPFLGFTGTVRVATADLTGDGIDDLIYASGAGRAEVRLVDGATGADLLTDTFFAPYESTFTGGLYVAATDLNGDGIAEIVVSPDTGGGARVQVFAVADGALVQKDNFFAIEDPDFRGGCRVAVGDLNGDGRPDLAVGAGTGGGPRVALFDGAGLLAHADAPVKLAGDFFAFPDAADLRGGVFVAAGDVDGDGIAELALAAGDGGGPRVLLTRFGGERLADFFPDDESLRGGARVAVKDADGDGLAELIVGSGAGTACKVQVFLKPGVPDQQFDPFGQLLPDGVYVG